MVTLSWLKIDDGFWCHQKVMLASPSALALWIRAGSWCAQQLTDGQLDARFLSLFGGTPDIADELVDLGLWERTATGFQFHDWLEYQPSKEQVLAERAAARERQQRKRRGDASGSSHGVTSAESHDRSEGVSHTTPPVPPARLPSSIEEGDEPPSPFCTKHPTGSGGLPCGPCADARKVYDIWNRRRRQAPTPIAPRVDLTPRCERHPDYPATKTSPCAKCAREREEALVESREVA